MLGASISVCACSLCLLSVCRLCRLPVVGLGFRFVYVFALGIGLNLNSNACGFCQLKACYEGTWFSISWTESVKGLGVTWCGQAGITCNGKEKTPQDTPKRSQDNPKTPTRLPQTPKTTPKPPRTPPGHTQTPPRPLQKPCKTFPFRADGPKRIPKGTLVGPF